MLVGFTRYSRDQTFAVLGQNSGFLPVIEPTHDVVAYAEDPPIAFVRTFKSFAGSAPIA
jgi:hypothetical protein